MSKELKKILDSIEKWVDKNDGNVAFIGSFISFDEKKMKNNEKDITKEDRILAYGQKDLLKIITDEHRKILKEEKEDFINL